MNPPRAADVGVSDVYRRRVARRRDRHARPSAVLHALGQ
jgi:hypothetical protein